MYIEVCKIMIDYYIFSLHQSDYVYFQDGEYIKVYQDNIGIKNIYHAYKEVYDTIYNFGVSKG